MIPANTTNRLNDLIGGLGMMIVFTIMWGIIAEVALAGKDGYTIGAAMGVIACVMVYHNYQLTRYAKKNHTVAMSNDTVPKTKQRFYIIFIIEGIAILIVKNILVNIGHNELFIPCFALVVGLHFFPLAIVFQRRMDIYIGLWMCLCAIVGLVLIVQKAVLPNLACAMVALTCSMATIANGVRMILEARKIVTGIKN